MAIYFNSSCDDHEWLSNFSRYAFELDGKQWPTVEHYLQAQRFDDADYQEAIRLCGTAKEARRLGHSRKHSRRPTWNEQRPELARRAVLQKFHTHSELMDLLLATGDEELIESTPSDYYWGCGAKRTGENVLGKILMELRANLGGAGAPAGVSPEPDVSVL